MVALLFVAVLEVEVEVEVEVLLLLAVAAKIDLVVYQVRQNDL